MEKSYKQLLENNKQWVASQLAQDPIYFDKLAHSQNPEYLWIGCSDSRVLQIKLLALHLEIFLFTAILPTWLFIVI